MSLDCFELTKAEKRNRVIWMGFTLLPYLGNSGIMAFYCVLAFMAAQFSVALVLLLLVPVLCLPGWALWHCIYKKHGTKLLTTILVCSSLLTVLFLFGQFNRAFSFALQEQTTGFISLWAKVLLCVLQGLWLALGFQLRNTNKKLSMQKTCAKSS